MDVFKFNPRQASSKLEYGEMVAGLKDVTWIERYGPPSEFTINGLLRDGLAEKLPVDSIISKVDSDNVMVVENHQINKSKDQEDKITITGRSLEARLFEDRAVGSNQNFEVSTDTNDFYLIQQPLADQILTLLKYHIIPEFLADPDDGLEYFEVISTILDGGVNEPRLIRRGDLQARVQELLAIENFGIKTIRPNPYSPAEDPLNNTAIVIHKGLDRTKNVAFSYDAGDIESAEYLVSSKLLKNRAFVYGSWVETVVNYPSPTIGIFRRTMSIDASDVDSNFQEEPPEGPIRDEILDIMRTRGKEALARQKQIYLARIELSKESTKAVYRKDFNVGDIVTIIGDYNVSTQMRVTEYVEIEDEEGAKGYPTLEAL